MKEALYEEETFNNQIDPKAIDLDLTMNQLRPDDNNNEPPIKTQAIGREDKQKKQMKDKSFSSRHNSLLSILPQNTIIKAYAFDLFKLISRQYRKYFSFCKAWSIMAQVLFVYLILIFIFLLVIVVTKASQIQSLLDIQSNKNYYTSIVREMIDPQRDLKIELDKLNNNIRMRNLEAPIVFMEVYTKELIKHKVREGSITNSDAAFLFKDINQGQDRSKGHYSAVSKGFVLMKTLKEIVLPSSSDMTRADLADEGYKQLIPFYYHFTPVLYQQLQRQGMQLESMYYASFPHSTDNSCESQYTSYFKYPIESNSQSIDSNSNQKPSDLFIDPVNKCFEPSSKPKRDSSFSEILQKTNWLYKLKEEDYNSRSKLIKLEHIDAETQKRDAYSMNYKIIPGICSTDAASQPRCSSHMLFAMKINSTSIERPYVKLNSNNDTLSFDYLSIINQPKASSGDSAQGASSDLFKGYTIDDTDSIVFDSPKFVKNLYSFTSRPQNQTDASNSHLFNYSAMDTIHNDNDLNYYFKQDINYFQLLVFLNDYLNYINAEPKPTGHPFKSFSYTQYHSYIQEAKIDCLEAFCYFNDCNSSSPLYVDPLYSQYMPNCYCLPLYAKDSLSDSKLDFHLKIKESYPDEKDKDFYAYDYPKKSFFSPYFNKSKKEFTCRMNFLRKSAAKQASFNSKITLQPIEAKDLSANKMLMFILNNNGIDKEIKERYDVLISDILWVLYLIYAIFLCIMVVLLTFFMYRNVLKLTMKMKKFEEYRQKIIPIGELNGNGGNGKVNTDINNDEEANPLLNWKGLSFLKKLHLFNSKEEDELDKLMKLISNNIDNFKVDFKVNGNINDCIRTIQKHYHEMNNINEYKSLFFLQRSPKAKTAKMKKNEYRKESIERHVKVSKSPNAKDIGIDLSENYSLNLLYEMLSMTDNHLLDFSSLKPNFYHTEDTMKSFINFSALEEERIIEEGNDNDEMSNCKKIDNSIKYYIKNIHSYWKQRYINMKTEEKTSPQANYI